MEDELSYLLLETEGDMADSFSGKRTELHSPARRGFAVTPHDTNELTAFTRAVWVGGAGNLSVILAGDTAAITITGVPAGTLLPLCCKIIRSTSTTATNIVGLY